MCVVAMTPQHMQKKLITICVCYTVWFQYESKGPIWDGLNGSLIYKHEYWDAGCGGSTSLGVNTISEQHCMLF